MNKKIQSLQSQNTWEYIYSPKNTNIIGTCFVYKIKWLADRNIEKYKARLVVQGYAQKDRIDFYSDNLFTLVTQLTTIQLLLSWAVSNNYKIH